jgi:hypothetical protein
MRREIPIPTPMRVSDLRAMLVVAGNTDPEVYVQSDGERSVLYVVQRLEDGRGLGKVLAERTIPTLPQEA